MLVGVGEVDGESHSIELQGLKPGSPYHIRVIAVNSAGSQQAEVSITTPSATQSNNGNRLEQERANIMIYFAKLLLLLYMGHYYYYLQPTIFFTLHTPHTRQ